MIEGIAIGLFIAATLVMSVNIVFGIKAERIAGYEKLDRGE